MTIKMINQGLLIALLAITFACNKSPVITESEKEWLKNHPDLNIGISTNQPPYEFINGKGQLDGMFINFLTIIEDRLDYEFKKIFQPDWIRLLSDAKDGKIDIVLEIQETNERKEFLNFTPFLLSHKHVIVVKKTQEDITSISNLKDKNIAVVNTYAVQEYLFKNYPGYSVIPFFDNVTGLRAVSTGQADAFIGQQAVATYYIETEGISNLKIAGEIDYPNELAIASRKDLDTLNIILSKAINSITKTEKQTIYNRWLSYEVKPFYAKAQFWIVILVIILVALAFVIFFNLALRNRVKQKTNELKVTKEKVEENYALLRIAGEKAKLGGWNVDMKENRSYWSDVVAAIHEMPSGYAPLVEDGLNFYAPEWRDRIIKVFADCATKGVPYDEEMEIIASSGKRIWIRTIGEAVKDENGNIYKVEGAFQDISEKKIAEAKVREKDLQFRKLSSNVPDLIFQFTRRPDGSYCVPVASEGIVNIFGCTPEDVIDDFTPIGKVIHPDDAERVIADIEYSAEHLTYFTCEFRVIIPGRPVQWILSRSTPEKLPDGNVTWYGFNANITHRKEVEDALKESEGKFRKIYEDGPFGMSLVNNEYKFIMANRTFCEIMGYTESELKKLTFNDITFPDDKSKGMESVKRLIKGKIPVVKLEKRYVRKNGQVIWGSITVAANFDKNGDFLYNLAIVEDITRRKLADEEIRSLNERLQMLVVAIQELSVSTSMENIMKTVRTSARKLVNADGSTFVLRDGDCCYYADEDTISPLWKGQRFPLTNCITGWAMLNKQAVIIEDIYSDERIPIEAYKSTFVRSLAVAPIRINDPLGAIEAYWGRNHIPSEMEIQLLQTLADAAAKAVENVQLIDGLEKRIIERTDQLQSVNKELEAFSYSVSHDLRAPLRHINGYAEILTRQYSAELSEDARKHLNTIIASAHKMGTLIDDLLSFSRTGRAELKKSSLSMEQVVRDAVTQIAPALKDRKIDWKISPLPVVNGDYNLLRSAWVNLLDNAVKYTTPKNIAKINIGYKVDNNMLVFHISDNGVGFDMKYSKKLFGVFQRLHSTSQFEGTGIGLANVRRIIVRHGGNTWAEAEPGNGATFYFSIPMT